MDAIRIFKSENILIASPKTYKMKKRFWYFNFEGQFTSDAIEYGGEKLFSSCLVPENNFYKAKSIFIKALSHNKINLLEIVEYYPIIYADLDLLNSQDKFWIEWCEKANIKLEPVFDVWHLYSE